METFKSTTEAMALIVVAVKDAVDCVYGVERPFKWTDTFAALNFDGIDMIELAIATERSLEVTKELEWPAYLSTASTLLDFTCAASEAYLSYKTNNQSQSQ